MSTKHTIPVVLVVLGWLMFPLIAAADPPLTATVRFGQENVANDIPPVGHPGSAAHHAVDSIVPRTVVISQGGMVTFNIEGPAHQIAVYQTGTKPSDIDTSLLTGGGAGCPPVPLINDPVGRIAILGVQPCAGGPTQVHFTFDEPGRYLIICTFLPHFADNDMYGWVIVR